VVHTASGGAAAVLVAAGAAKPDVGVVGRDALSAGRAASAVAGLLVLAQRQKALSSLASEARMILRLWGLLDMYFWARTLVSKTAKKLSAKRNNSSSASASASTSVSESLITVPEAVSYLQLVSCIIFQALENGAYLSARGVLGWTPAQQGSAFRWSSRFWALYVGAELGKLAAGGLARRHRLLPPSSAVRTAVGTQEEKTEVEDGAKTDRAEAESKWRKQVVRNAAWAPLTLHWSTQTGLVSEAVVGLLGSVPGIVQMRDLWRETAA
jgi:hypothetical protein